MNVTFLMRNIMEFWMGIVIFLFVSFYITFVFKKEENYILNLFIVFILTFFSAFRYEIGWDYSTYQDWYKNVDLNSLYPMEISFKLLVHFLNECGFDFQILFFIYAMFTSLFIWKGINYYIFNEKQRTIALIIYGMAFWFIGLDQIRQFICVSIFFWGSKYIVERKTLKYLLVCIVCFFLHYSSFFMVFIYLLVFVKHPKIFSVIIILMGIIFNYFQVGKKILLLLIESLGLYSKYTYFIDNAEENKIGFGFLFILIMFVFSFLFNDDKDKKGIYLLLFSIAILVKFVFLDFIPIYRIRLYFEIFSIIAIPIACFSLKRKMYVICTSIILLSYAVLFLNSLYKAPDEYGKFDSRISVGNLDYKFNFKLLK